MLTFSICTFVLAAICLWSDEETMALIISGAAALVLMTF